MNWKPVRLRFVCSLALLLALAGLAQAAPQNGEKHQLTVSAAISLKDALDEIGHLYLADTPQTEVHFNLGASGTLLEQIEQGAPVDVFISAAPDQMDALASKGLLLAGTRKDLVTNGVVLIVPVANTSIGAFSDLLDPSVKVIAIGEPRTVPAGKYAQQALSHMGIYEQLKPRLVLAKDVRQVLTYVATGNADAGIVYSTDAKTSPQVRIAAIAPEDSHSPVIYPVAAIKGSHDPGEAKKFEEFLLGPKARAVFEKYGFAAAAR